MSGIINQFFAWISEQLAGVAASLPQCPFTFEKMAGLEQIMGYVNYVIPLGSMLKVTTAWVGAILIYYGVQIILRWVQAIE